jgi:hypothetical protein
MNSHMLLKLVTVCKCRDTQYATVWFSPVWTLTCRVRSRYLTKNVVHCWQNILVLLTGTSLECIYRHWEARFPICATQCATKWHFTCMNSHMTGKVLLHCWQLNNFVFLRAGSIAVSAFELSSSLFLKIQKSLLDGQASDVLCVPYVSYRIWIIIYSVVDPDSDP